MSPTRSTPPTTTEQPALLRVAQALLELERRLVKLERQMQAALERVPPGSRESARNLVHYIALRQQDLRPLQAQLAQLGLSSLGRSESCVRGSLLQVLRRADEALSLRGNESTRPELARLDAEVGTTLTWHAATGLLRQHTRDLLGPEPGGRHIYIMVTAPSAREADRTWMVKMLSAGMNVLRINGAHEGPEAWMRLAAALDGARRQTGRPCRILVDLPGPRIRTGPIAGGTRVGRWKPTRDELGHMTAPARIPLRPSGASLEDVCTPGLTLDPEAYASLGAGDVLHFADARGKPRTLEIGDGPGGDLVGYCTRRTYVLGSVRATVVRSDTKVAEVDLAVSCGEGAAIDVQTGDRLILTARHQLGSPPQRDPQGRVLQPGVVACTLPSALRQLQVGHRVRFDEGRIDAVVEKTVEGGGDYLLRVTHTQKERIKLRAEKGINLPDTAINLPAVTSDDEPALAFAVQHADAVGLSFVKRPEDVRALHQALESRGRPDLGVVLKVETRSGFEHLPRLLLEGLRRPPIGVMIARGDLAMEVGFERLAELQEEILWLCEASHVPAIWATQVLDTLARTGVPSRAEVTDAAASVAAECVMLNKGPFVAEAVQVLDDILRRMEKHRYKKRSLFRRLRVSTFHEPPATGHPELAPPAG